MIFYKNKNQTTANIVANISKIAKLNILYECILHLDYQKYFYIYINPYNKYYFLCQIYAISK